MTLGGDSIPAVARERESIAPPFCTPPDSPFCALSPNGYPLMEPTCRRGEKDGLLSAVLMEKFLINCFKFKKLISQKGSK